MNFSTLHSVDGISNNNRMNNALTRNALKIHDLTFEELISCSKQYGKLIKFVNSKNEYDGTWADCFNSDELTVFSDIKCFDTSSFVKNSLRILNSPDITRQKYSNITISLLYILKKVDMWYLTLRKIDNNAAAQCAAVIENIVNGNYRQIYSEMALLLGMDGTDNVNELYRLSLLWNRNAFISRDVQNVDRKELCKKQIVALNSLISNIKNVIGPYSNDSLRHCKHSPESGLFIVFANLLSDIQKEINRIPSRFVWFYYNKVLQFKQRESIPDKSVVALISNTSSNSDIQIPAGTEFIAAKNETVLRYTTDNELIVKPAVVDSVYSLNFQKDPFIEPEKSLGYYSGIRVNEFVNFNSNDKMQCYPVFGAAINGKEVKNTGTAIRTGLAITSRIFFLAEGERYVKLHFCMDSNLCSMYKDVFKETIAVDFNKNDDNIISSSINIDNKIVRILNSLFVIQLTTPEGWYTVSRYLASTVNTGVTGDSKSFNVEFTIEFTIPVNAPEIVSYSQSIHGGAYTTSLPVCSLTFNDNAEIYPYSLLKGLNLHFIHIDVSVTGVTDLVLYNQYGAIDSNTPFMPFGPLPVKGDHLIIGYHEMSIKNVDTVDIEIEWANVPFQNNGFREYYQGYSCQLTNNSFEVILSELLDSKWIVNERNKNGIRLFETEYFGQTENDTGIGKVLPEKYINKIILTGFKEKEQLIPRDAFTYTTKSKNGYLRLALSNPSFGFGHALYANDATSTLIEQLYKKKKVTMIASPFVPVIKDLRLNYHSHTQINFAHVYPVDTDLLNKDGFFHIYPLGIQQMFPVNDLETITFIPEIDKCGKQDGLAGNLFIGLKGKKVNGTLSLYFRMTEDVFTKDNEKVHWFYLHANQWIEIEPRSIIEDTTHGLVTSGIITLFLPDDFNCEQTNMPQGRFWLRAAVKKNAGLFGSVCGIRINAVLLTRNRTDCMSSENDDPIPSGTIKESAAAIPGVDSIMHPVGSYGGEGAEDESAYVTRISERLRHKNRVSTANDYEQIILQKFPEVLIVKCFPNMISGDTRYFRPGHVLIAVVAKHGGCDIQMPRLNTVVLKEIESYVKSKASPFVNIEVINPVFEEIQIRCSVVITTKTEHTNIVYNVNKEISEFISPWSQKSGLTCFGWKIRLQEMQQYIRNLPQVAYITDFSVLHKTAVDSRRYQLFDSADTKGEPQGAQMVEPHLPWSIAVPFRYHAIEVIDNVKTIRPDITGINKAEVGNILIVKGNDDYGITEQKNT